MDGGPSWTGGTQQHKPNSQSPPETPHVVPRQFHTHEEEIVGDDKDMNRPVQSSGASRHCLPSRKQPLTSTLQNFVPPIPQL